MDERAAKYAVEGKSLFDASDSEFSAMQMLVVDHFEPEAQKGIGIETVGRILDSHKVRLFRQTQLPELTKEIREHGHVLTT